MHLLEGFRRNFSANFVLAITILTQYSPTSFTTNALPNRPGLFGIIPPPQVLLPPHREEGQSLDDIIYGTSFSGGSLFPSLNSRSASPTTTPRNNFFSVPNPSRAPLPFDIPSPPSSAQKSFNPRGRTNPAQNFFKSSTVSAAPSPVTSTSSATSVPFQPNSIFSSSSRPFPPPSSSSNHHTPTSAEEIKIPQTLKHRSTQRKQYTKADLIAAANSLKPAGFDFNKIGPINFSPRTTVANKTSTNIYHNARFPLPLFDTPVFNELKPLMDMILKQQHLQQQQQQQADNNKKVIVIIPKTSGNINNERKTTSNHNTGSNRQAKQISAFPSSSSPRSALPQAKSSFSSKFTAPPKTTKLSTTTKPKPFTAPTTKRSSTKLSEVSRKLDRNPDLLVAATSNKLSQQRSTGGKSLSSSGDSDKRSYSLKGADNYSFSYEVKNDAFGDVKSHSESRNGDVVAGQYSMLDPDGYTRIVRYTVDSDQGFKASVKRIPPS